MTALQLVSGTPADAIGHRRSLAIVAGLTAIVLVATANSQLYDTNFQFVAEGTALLAGDHPYRDFYEWGAPLAAYFSAAFQLLVGYRIIDEFVLQWLFIVAGVVVSFHLGLSLSRSRAASFVLFALTLVLIADTPIYHYPKIFFFPLAIWLAWRYMDQPGASRGALMGIATAVAFLFRHDYGAYFGFASVAAFLLARVRFPESRRARHLLTDAAAYAVAVVLCLAPWAAVVQVSEGLFDFARMRREKYLTPDDHVVYSALLRMNPMRQLMPAPTPPPTPAVVGFFWKPEVDAMQRQSLERQFGLRLLAEVDPRKRLRYEVPNVYDGALFGLDPYITDGAGFEWDRIEEVRWRLPTHDNVALWLEQMALLIPVILLLSAAGALVRGRRGGNDQELRDACRMVLAGALLAVVDSALFRQPSYAVAVAPVTTALSARFLTARTGGVGRSCAVVALVLTGFAAAVWSRDSLLFRPSELPPSVSSAFRELLASPPVSASPSRVLHYLHDCTAPGDRLLVSGSTPFQVNYYAERPFAGHHFWRDGWRSDPIHEQQLLELLRRQSIPFAFSTHEPVHHELQPYPNIREHLTTNYVEVEGFQGRLLVDRRRRPTRTYGSDALPCFR
jgi:type IV secretory pathway VirB2 component (pilin)